MKKDEKKVLLIAAVAAVGAFFYYRKRKKAQGAVEEPSGEVLRYEATDLHGLQIDVNVGDTVEIVSSGGQTGPDWELVAPSWYPPEAIKAGGEAMVTESLHVWSVRAVFPPGPPPAPGDDATLHFKLMHKFESHQPPQINFLIKVHAP